MSGANLEQAQQRAAAARASIRATVTTLRDRVNPRNVAQDAVEKVADRSLQAIDTGAEVAARNPKKIIALAIALTLLLNRRRIVGMIRPDPATKATKPARPRRVSSKSIRPAQPKRKPL